MCSWPSLVGRIQVNTGNGCMCLVTTRLMCAISQHKTHQRTMNKAVIRRVILQCYMVVNLVVYVIQAHARIMRGTCQNHARTMPGLCQDYARTMPGLCHDCASWRTTTGGRQTWHSLETPPLNDDDGLCTQLRLVTYNNTNDDAYSRHCIDADSNIWQIVWF